MLEYDPGSAWPKNVELESSEVDAAVTVVLAVATRGAVPGWVTRATAAKPPSATAAVMPIA